MVTRNGHPAAILVSIEQWERKTRRTGNLAEFFAASPLSDSELSIERFRKNHAKSSCEPVDPIAIASYSAVLV